MPLAGREAPARRGFAKETLMGEPREAKENETPATIIIQPDKVKMGSGAKVNIEKKPTEVKNGKIC